MRLGSICIFITVIATAAVTFLANAQTIYKVVAADGTVTYTDQPVPGSEPVRLGKLNTAEPLAVTQPIQTTVQQPQQRYDLTISSPANEATIRNNLGEVTLSAAVSPRASGRYQLTLDGNLHSENNSGVFRLEGVERGAHQYQISFLDNTGKILASSPQQTFFMHKASALINSN